MLYSKPNSFNTSFITHLSQLALSSQFSQSELLTDLFTRAVSAHIRENCNRLCTSNMGTTVYVFITSIMHKDQCIHKLLYIMIRQNNCRYGWISRLAARGFSDNRIFPISLANDNSQGCYRDSDPTCSNFILKYWFGLWLGCSNYWLKLHQLMAI